MCLYMKSHKSIVHSLIALIVNWGEPERAPLSVVVESSYYRMRTTDSRVVLSQNFPDYQNLHFPLAQICTKQRAVLCCNSENSRRSGNYIHTAKREAMLGRRREKERARRAQETAEERRRRACAHCC